MRFLGLYLTQFVNLFLAASDIAVRYVRLLLDLHHRHGRVDLWRERDVNLVLVAVHADTHAFLYVRRSNLRQQHFTNDVTI